MLRVCLIGLIAGGHSGVPRYAAALARGLDRVAPEFPQLELSLLTTDRGAREADAHQISVERVPRRFAEANAGPLRVIAEQLHARSAAADLLHFFDLTGPALAWGRPFVTTIHDAATLYGFEQARIAHKRLIQPRAIRRCSAAVAVSAFARDEAVRLLDADPAKVHVIHSGPGLLGETEAVGSVVDAPYVLFVGNLASNKNVPFLVRSFAKASVDAKLVLAGRRGRDFEEINRVVAASSEPGRIEIRHDVSDADVDSLYRGAAMLVLPSRYEGFGFTALEAMSRGCPVLASDIPALREISGKGAMLLPLDDEAAWADAIRRTLSDQALREELRAAGSRCVARYSWEETARSVCRTFLSVGGRPG